MVEWFKKRLEWLIALLVVVDGVRNIIVPILQNSVEFNQFFAKYQVYILEFLVFICLIVIFILLLRSSSFRSQYARLDKLIEFESHFNSCGPLYRAYAFNNAECDRDLFKTLFVDLEGAPADLRKSLILAAIELVHRNLQQTLTTAAQVMATHVGSRCAACVQLVDPGTGLNVMEACVETIARDTLSMGDRPLTKGGQAVKDNTLNQRIYRDHEEYVIVNDFAAERLKPGFVTTSAAGPATYNALFILAVPNLAKSRQPNGRAHVHNAPHATLCIDSPSGGFNGALHLRILQEFAWRLAIMLYRLNSLEYICEREKW